MKQELVRFGIAMEPNLLEQIDALAQGRGCTRSELLRDLARAEVVRAEVQSEVPAIAAVTLVYNHHVRELSERLTTLQHDLGDCVVSTMHVHLDHEHCLEMIAMRGPSGALSAAAEKMRATRGVTHGGIELVAESALSMSASHRHKARGALDHAQDPPHVHRHARSPKAPTARKKAAAPRQKRARP